jgi:hypothetical protein
VALKIFVSIKMQVLLNDVVCIIQMNADFLVSILIEFFSNDVE